MTNGRTALRRSVSPGRSFTTRLEIQQIGPIRWMRIGRPDYTPPVFPLTDSRLSFTLFSTVMKKASARIRQFTFALSISTLVLVVVLVTHTYRFTPM